MKGRVSRRTSAIVYAILILCFVIGLAGGMSFFRQSPIAMMLGGFMGSLLFFFLVVFIGLVYELMGKKEKPGLVPILVSLVICYVYCLVVHPFCFLFCVAFSVPMVTYMSKASHMKRPQPKPKEKRE